MTKILMSDENPTGYKLEELVETLASEMQTKTSKIINEESPACQNAVANNNRIVELLSEIKTLQDNSMEGFAEEFGEDKGPNSNRIELAQAETPNSLLPEQLTKTLVNHNHQLSVLSCVINNEVYYAKSRLDLLPKGCPSGPTGMPGCRGWDSDSSWQERLADELKQLNSLSRVRSGFDELLKLTHLEKTKALEDKSYKELYGHIISVYRQLVQVHSRIMKTFAAKVPDHREYGTKRANSILFVETRLAETDSPTLLDSLQALRAISESMKSLSVDLNVIDERHSLIEEGKLNA